MYVDPSSWHITDYVALYLPSTRPERYILQRQICYNFWHHFFDVNCQRPTQYVRLFPTNRSFRFIWEFYFASWFKKLYPLPEPCEHCSNIDDDITLTDATECIECGRCFTEEEDQVFMPSLTTFQRARRHPDFKDVVDRAKHYHARCHCARLMARRLKGFLNNQQLTAWNFELKAHELAAAGWHELEERTKSRARAEPSKLLYITGDDTSCLGLPKFTVRD